MKKLGIIAAAALLLTALAVSGALAADKADWKVGGNWDYAITIPEFTAEFDGVPVKISAEQTGIINITATDSEKEAGKECIEGGAVRSVRSSLKYVLPDGTEETPSAYLEGPMSLGEAFKKDPYNPGEELSFTAPLYYDTKEGKQIVGFMSATFSQKGKDKFEGAVTLTMADETTQKGTFEATRPSADWKVGGGWDFVIGIPEFEDEVGGVPFTVKAELAGLIDIAAALNKDGTERIESGEVGSMKTTIYSSSSEEPIVIEDKGPYPLPEGFKKDPYVPGEEMSFTFPIPYPGEDDKPIVTYWLSAKFRQTKENKFVGDVKLSKTPDGEPIVEGGIFEATKRSKDSSSGCNAGFGALVLLTLAGLFYRKKK